tara:strand:+ start:302 stop:562 length:261 start_codon:yes stop_codon:yes gene_type:complete
MMVAQFQAALKLHLMVQEEAVAQVRQVDLVHQLQVEPVELGLQLQFQKLQQLMLEAAVEAYFLVHWGQVVLAERVVLVVNHPAVVL